MSRRNGSWYEDREKDPDTDRSLFSRIVEGVIVFAVCCFLVKLGVSYILAVRIPLIVISVTLGIIYITYRAYKRRDRDDY